MTIEFRRRGGAFTFEELEAEALALAKDLGKDLVGAAERVEERVSSLISPSKPEEAAAERPLPGK